MGKRTIVIALSSLVIIWIPTPAIAGPQTPPAVSCQRLSTEEVTSVTLSELSGRLLSQGKTQDEVDQAMQDQLCLKKVGSGAIVQAQGADPTDIRWTSSSIFYDNGTKKYHANIAFSWYGNNDWYSDVPYFNGCYNTGIGGPDGLGLRLSGGEYSVSSYSMLIWGRADLDQYDGDYGYVTQTAASNVSQYGVGFTRQDNARSTSSGGFCMGGIHYKDYDMKNGQIFATVRALNGICRSAQVFGDYAHTWSSTSITGVSAGPYSFGLQWAGGSSYFDSSAGGQVASIC